MSKSNSDTISASNSSSYMSRRRRASLSFYFGLTCAIISIVIVPEIFGSAAIILGAYTWRLERDENRSRGLILIIFGVVAMLAGIYYTSLFGIYNILP